MVEEAHRLLRAYCEGVEDFFGKQSCTMNMHLHLHLRDCAMDYGPLYGYWCFPFERYNGTIGNYTTNYKSIEKQFASKCLWEQLVRTKSIPLGATTSVHLFKILLLMNAHLSCLWINFNELNIFRRCPLFAKKWIMLLVELIHSLQ